MIVSEYCVSKRSFSETEREKIMYKFLIDSKNNHQVIYPHNIGYESIWVLEIGSGAPTASYRYDPIPRNIYVLHYVRSGRGIFNRTKIQGPCTFLMTPEVAQCFEVASDCNDFDHCWIKFTGPAAAAFLSEAGFPDLASVFPCPYIEEAYQMLTSIINDVPQAGEDRFFLLEILFRLMALQSESVQKVEGKQAYHNFYTRQILKCIHENYNTPLSETAIANSVNISKNYMHKVFRNETGMTPLNYLTKYRIQCAQKLLLESSKSIAKIGELCGYPEPIYFSYIFKKVCGMTPSVYRKQSAKMQ